MIPTVIAPHTPDAPLGETPSGALAPLNPLPACGEGRQSVALAGWGSSDLVSNQADMILLRCFLAY